MRVLTAALLIPLVLGIILLGGAVYSATIGFVLIMLIFEWGRMVDGEEFSRAFFALSVTGIAAVVVAAAGFFGAACLVALGGGALATLLKGAKSKRFASLPFAGAVYLVLPAIAALYLRHHGDEGLAFTLILFTVVWATDSGAYLFGKLIGGPKLWPSLSPKKTWVGAGGGLLCGALTGLTLGAILGVDMSLLGLAVLGGALAVAAIVGDLIESGLKRAHHIKDAGGVIPGHGGTLDRLDGFIVAATVLASYLILRQSIGL